MKAPSASHQLRFNHQCVFSSVFFNSCQPSCRNKPVVPVVIDPVLGRKLRPHQIEGDFVTSTLYQPD